jgi:hypothetical protein
MARERALSRQIPMYVEKMRGVSGFWFAKTRALQVEEGQVSVWTVATVHPDGRVEVHQASLDTANANSRKKEQWNPSWF